MSRQSLYLKYRPGDFENLIGQEYVKRTLINGLKSQQIAHAYLFSGPRGTGKTSSARLIAKAMNCENLKDGYEPCDQCEMCKDINSGRLIDLIEIDAASNRGIDEVRDLKEKINFAPSRSKYKIYIIDEVHMMTKEAFNALLKTLEEPPAHAYFILATTEVHKIPETIISRCQRFDFRRVSREDLVARLADIAAKEGIEVEAGALEMIAKYVDGGVRDAIGLLEQLNENGALRMDNVRKVLGVSDLSLLENLFAALVMKKVGVGLKIINEVYTQGSDLRQFSHEFVDLMRMKMLENIEQGKAINSLLEFIDLFQEAQGRINSTIPQLALEIAVIRACGVDKVVMEEEVVAPVAPVEAPKVVKVEKKAPVAVAVAAAAVKEEPVIVPPVAQKREHKALGGVEDVKSKWSEIVEAVKIPSLRMSLKNAKPLALDGCEIKLEFGSTFHMVKVENHDNRVALEELIKQILGADLKVVTVLNEGKFEPAPVIHRAEPETGLDELDKEEPHAVAVDEALDIFGGELVS